MISKNQKYMMKSQNNTFFAGEVNLDMFVPFIYNQGPKPYSVEMALSTCAMVASKGNVALRVDSLYEDLFAYYDATREGATIGHALDYMESGSADFLPIQFVTSVSGKTHPRISKDPVMRPIVAHAVVLPYSDSNWQYTVK